VESRYVTRRVIVIVAIAAILSGSALFSFDFFKAVYPRPLHVGDRWAYDVLFPDSSGYRLTEIVQQEFRINDTETFVIFSDDAQHISTTYLWLTEDWHEVRTLKPQIGNLNASSVTTYRPPVELVHVPLHVGDKWQVNSSVTTLTLINNRTQINVSSLLQTRQIISLEKIQTPVGGFQAFKVSVRTQASLFEMIWFSGDLGQIVYAEFYNPLGETVTETLTGYSLNDSLAHNSTFATAQSVLSIPSSALPRNDSEVISTTNSAVSVELKNS
jgi:hypothetical protein